MESEFNECSLFEKHENKEATIRIDRQFSATKRSLLVDVIRPFCSAHNTTVAAERRLQTSPSQASLCIRSSQSMAALMHLSFPIERPAALFFLAGHFTIRTSNTSKYSERENTFYAVLFLCFSTRSFPPPKKKTHSRTGGAGVTAVCVRESGGGGGCVREWSRRGSIHASGSLY